MMDNNVCNEARTAKVMKDRMQEIADISVRLETGVTALATELFGEVPRELQNRGDILCFEDAVSNYQERLATTTELLYVTLERLGINV